MFAHLARRIRALFTRNADLTDELRFHLEQEAAALERQGMSPENARTEARRRLGGVDRYTEELRDVRGGRALEYLAQDTRFAFRVARRFPGFTAIVVATLALAIGSSTAIFSVINAVLLRPLPFPSPEQLVLLYAQNPDRSQPRFSVSYADYLDWRQQTRSFTDIAAIAPTAPTIVGDGEPERLNGLAVTSNFFDVLGEHASVGRLFGPEDRDGESSDAIVLSDGFWRRRFAGDARIVGSRLQLADRARTIIGVLPAAFDLGGNNPDVITVLAPSSISGALNHSQHVLQAIGRLKRNVSLAQAQQELAAVAARLADAHADIRGWSANVFRLSDELSRTVKNPLLILLAAAVLVLLIGCMNVANLLITRAAGREHEVALRQALGASRRRLVSQLLVESTLLSLAGGLAGVGLASVGARTLLRFAPTGAIPQVGQIGVDGRVLAFALGLSLLSATLVGLWPALRATSPRLSSSLRDGGRTSAGGASAPRMRRMLVVAEVSLAVVLLACSMLVVQSLRRILSVDAGFQIDNIVTMRVNPGAAYNDSTLIALYRDLTTRIAGRGGIESVAAANIPPLSAGGITTGIRLIGRQTTGGEPIMSAVTAITPGYFGTTNIRLLRGRDVSWSDPKPTLIVSEAAAKSFWPGEDPVGKRVAFGRVDTLGLEVIGVAADSRSRGLTTDPIPVLYMSYRGATSVARSMLLIVRGRGEVGSIVNAAKAATREIDPMLPLYNVRTLRDIIDQSVAQPRLNTYLLSIFAGMALLLATLGIYGVVSFSVAQRTREIGVRIALGAQPSDVVGLVLREGAVLAVIGVLIGLAMTAGATSLIQNWLFGIGRGDPMTMAATSASIVVIALLASFIPARRAARVDVVMAMRE
jgi:putative ABC transport system permease protein